MRTRNESRVLKLGVLALTALALGTFAPQASASVIGHLSVTNCQGGGVIVALSTIDWLPETAGPPESSCLQLGALTNITSVGDGSLTPASPNGTINDLPPNAGVAGFMSFANLHFDLAAVGGFGPGSGVSCAVNPGVGLSCSIPGSPFLLTQTSTGTSVTLLAHGTIFDVGDGLTSTWSGSFTTQINTSVAAGDRSPAGIQNLILVNAGSITSTFSGEFDVTAVPEPISMSLIGFGLIGLVAVKKRILA